VAAIGDAAVAAIAGAQAPTQPKPPPKAVEQCPRGHDLKPWAAIGPGTCDGCNKAVQDGEHVLDCRSCNWYLCTLCSVGSKRRAGSLPEVAEKLLAPFVKGSGARQDQRKGSLGFQLSAMAASSEALDLSRMAELGAVGGS
jgi:hypothetical protein